MSFPVGWEDARLLCDGGDVDHAMLCDGGDGWLRSECYVVLLIVMLLRSTLRLNLCVYNLFDPN